MMGREGGGYFEVDLSSSKLSSLSLSSLTRLGLSFCPLLRLLL